jgi:hypothetical protein
MRGRREKGTESVEEEGKEDAEAEGRDKNAKHNYRIR